MSERLSVGWWAAVAVFFAVLTAGLHAVSTRLRFEVGEPPRGRPLPTIVVAEGAEAQASLAWVESAALLGPTPLFLPTSVNTSAVEPPVSLRREPGAQTATFPARLYHDDQGLRRTSASPFPVVTEAAAVLTLGETANLWPTFGERTGFSDKTLKPRALRIEAMRSPGGEVAWAADLAKDEAPGPVPVLDWRPMDFLVTVAAEGGVGSPVLVQGSGLAEWDQTVHAWLLRQSQLGFRLWPGVYSVRVGP